MSSSSDQNPSVDKQIAEILLKVVGIGGLAGGGMGAFWQLFQNSDIPKALASLTIGAGLSYGTTLLKSSYWGSKKRAEAINKKIEAVTSNLIAAATGVENKYLLCQAAAVQAFRSEGMASQDGIFIPLLKEVFVSLELDTSAMEAGYWALHNASDRDNQNLTIWRFLEQAETTPTFRRLAILAWGGYGKTTLLRHIAFRYGTRDTPEGAPKLVPFLLVLRDYRDLLASDRAPSLEELITEHHIPDLPDAHQLGIPKEWVIKQLRDGRALVMFDSFDEVSSEQRPKVARWLKQQMNRYSQSFFILTSRPKAYQEQEFGSHLELNTPLWIRNFSTDQSHRFIIRWYECQERYASGGRDTPDVEHQAQKASTELIDQIEHQNTLKDLAKNPLLLNIITTFHRRVPGAELPKRRVELYREICRLQLVDRPRARGVAPIMTQCDAQGILQQVAFAMMQKHWERIPETALLKGLSSIIQKRQETFSAEYFLTEVVQVSELLVHQEGEYEFAHLSFQEYLAATHIAQTKQEQRLYPHFTDGWWKATILLYSAQVNPNQLIREALNRDAWDVAYSCLQETTRKVDEDLQAKLQASPQHKTNA